jgi:hypothetical protein
MPLRHTVMRQMDFRPVEIGPTSGTDVGPIGRNSLPVAGKALGANAHPLQFPVASPRFPGLMRPRGPFSISHVQGAADHVTDTRTFIERAAYRPRLICLSYADTECQCFFIGRDFSNTRFALCGINPKVTPRIAQPNQTPSMRL